MTILLAIHAPAMAAKPYLAVTPIYYLSIQLNQIATVCHRNIDWYIVQVYIARLYR